MSPVVDFDTPLSKVVGKGHVKLGKELELHTVRELLFHLPRRYEQRGSLTDIRSLEADEQVTIQARVLSVRSRRMRNRPGSLLEAVVTDDSGGTITLVFFGKHSLAWLERALTPGRWGLFAGKVSDYRSGRQQVRQLAHPKYELLDEPEDRVAEDFAAELIPIYPATKEVTSWELSKAIRMVLDVVTMPPDPLPAAIRSGRRLADLGAALRDIHRPTSWETLAPARRRLKWDEAFAVQLTLVQRRRRAEAWPATPRPYQAGGILDAFDARLPYELTGGQQAVGEQLAAELAQSHPMHRLLQGEVGSGKTVCALRAALQVVDAGGQAALLAPTEVLAAQHYRGVAELLGPLGRAGELAGDTDGTQLALLTGSLPAAARRRALAAAASGEAGIVVGTHALLYDQVAFRDLGLVIVDEQHRFGVEQRDALRAKAEQPPHVLVMTATPIPRTVAMTVYGDLTVSTLRELPRGRSPITTHVVPAAEQPALLARGWQRAREEVAAGHQVYVVCPRIGDTEPEEAPGPESESADESRRPPLAVLEVAESLAAGPLSELRVRVLHGRLPADEKDAVMRAFAAGEVDVVVSTTVVEVGVDVPNATMMIVLDADRFGVSQLHQLRGRVGRGSAPGLCLLVTEAEAETPARERLAAVASTLDGFELAELDVEQRREGDVLGAMQSGRRSHLRLLSLLKDADLIAEARTEAEQLLADDPELTEHPGLAAVVEALVDEERAEYLEKT
ncbi:ATP-dependent DNA helicase RecG [Natronosporangium hydrolyticum]|uniref:Probable DNA 3'-5' helicase RecG n=1 Tax=Natronosporangium hydrolyticum TaxID=2811111 RepID=A0A895YBH1_9ACTN|nr:ATP-dependent DNA helicase RecG [Natronosporangium hydrolyticum]QSB13582.1 ATP-dependent DNA helicase RecG [Natronosporangium hydrolyticum]